jgi:6-phosphofructokinase
MTACLAGPALRSLAVEKDFHHGTAYRDIDQWRGLSGPQRGDPGTRQGVGTQKNALRLAEAGLNVVTLPKTIDNDITLTDRTFGFDTALQIATEAIDRLHSTATSHERIIVVEVMGHRAGWLALEAGIAGGADVILLPEIPYELRNIAKAIRRRTQSGKRFSIVVVAEGAISTDDAEVLNERRYGVMLGLQGSELKHVPLAALAGKIRQVPLDHPLIASGRRVGTSFGD